MGCFIYRFVVVSYTVEEMRASYKEQIVDVSAVAFWDQVENSALNPPATAMLYTLFH